MQKFPIKKQAYFEISSLQSKRKTCFQLDLFSKKKKKKTLVLVFIIQNRLVVIYKRKIDNGAYIFNEYLQFKLRIFFFSRSIFFYLSIKTILFFFDLSNNNVNKLLCYVTLREGNTNALMSLPPATIIYKKYT